MDLSGSPSQSPVLPKRKRASARKSIPTPSILHTDQLGRYRITGQLGRGGMGIVYDAEDTLLERKVAIKLLPKEVSSNPEALTRFLREAQAAARLNHANVVAVYDLGETDDTHYIVMERIDGGNAQEILRERGPFHWREGTSILMDVCRGVAAAHRAGLIHRDIKPANILRSTEGVVKLGDFGLVKPAGIKGSGVTALGEIVGTPHYMSPEQSRCDTLDERSDIYSLGATYYALLTGRPPFDSPDRMQVLFAHCAQPTPDPRDLVCEIPEPCVAIVRKAMEKHRTQRYRDSDELLADLERVLVSQPATTRGEKSSPPFVWCGASRSETTNLVSLASVYPGERSEAGIERRSRRRKIVGISGLALFVAAILVAVGNHPGTGPTPLPQPEAMLVLDEEGATQAAEAERAVRSRNAKAMKQAFEKLQVLRHRTENRDPGRQEAIRRTLTRVEKALAFRESITEKGLVLGLDGQVTSVLFSPDDRRLAIGQAHGGAGALVLDGLTGETRYTLWPRRDRSWFRVESLAFNHRSDSLAAACSDHCIKIAHLAEGRESSFDLGTGVKRARSVAFSPASGNLVAGSETVGEGKGKPYLRIWNLDTGEEPFRFKAEHSANVVSVAFSAGGLQIATGSDDQRVVMWNAETGRIWRELRTGLRVRAIACSPHGRTAVVTGFDRDDSILQFWDYAAEKRLAAIRSPHGPCHCVAFSRDGSLLASGSGSRVLLWNPETFTLLATLTGHSQDVNSVAFSADGTILVTGSNDQTARLWDVTRFLPLPTER